MEYIVWINPDEYKDFMNKLGEYGFTWISGNKAGDGSCIMERIHDKNYATTYHLNFDNKKLSYFPLEVYGPDSEVRDNRKFEKYKTECKSCEWIIKNILCK